MGTADKHFVEFKCYLRYLVNVNRKNALMVLVLGCLMREGRGRSVLVLGRVDVKNMLRLSLSPSEANRNL